MKTFFNLLTTAALAAMAAGQGHDDPHEGHSAHKGHKCACDARMFGFTIDCTNTQAVTDALAQLQALQCAQDCHNDACERNWLVVQSHHDHCPIDSLPIAVENGFHDYDRVCDLCDIARKEVAGAPTCPTVNCDDGSGNEAYQRLLTRNCNLQFQCTETNCRDDYLTLRMVHDTCDHGSLSQSAEEGLHALEEPCAAFTCNLPADVIAESLTCSDAELEETLAHHSSHNHGDDHDDDGHNHGSSPTRAPTNNNNNSGGGFDMGSGAASLATGTIAAMTLMAAGLF